MKTHKIEVNNFPLIGLSIIVNYYKMKVILI
ncbi:Uncharacterised protein [uncultured archaeon]|nr:Uncharacterised protein [uncultured archaeon]